MNLAYHFVGETLRDGRPVPKDGEWLEHDGPLEMCVSGLHFSRHPFDALQYAPGETLCLVEVGGKIIEPNDDDKGICSRRRIVKRVDLTENLRYFARMQAMSVIHLYPGEPDDIVLDYLMTGDSAAWSVAEIAAESAAEIAAESAARNAAESAARSAAEIAAMGAADIAARSAADIAARSAARNAAWSAAEIAAMGAARSAAMGAAWSAAWSAARNAAESAQREYFLMLCEEALSCV